MYKNPLIKLLFDNKTKPRAHAVPLIKNETSGEIDFYLYDFVASTIAETEYWGGIAAEALVPQIRALTNETINLRINSPGGDVFGGQAIAQALRDHQGKVIAHIDGDAASIASVIAMSADEVVIAVGGMMMIHNSSTIVWGNRNEMRQTADLLEKIDGVIAGSYASKTKKDAAEFVPLMDATTWFTADEAVAIGLADRIAITVKAEHLWDLSAYKNIAPPAPPATPPAPKQITDDHRARQQQRIKLIQANLAEDSLSKAPPADQKRRIQLLAADI